MGDQKPERRGDRSLEELSDDELEELISELAEDDPMARAVRALIDRRRPDRDDG